jgi:pimeloyl-ACP methyl ester carboxylesterase
VTTVARISAEDFAARAVADGELGLAVRGWTGGVRIRIGDDLVGFGVKAGQLAPELPELGPGVIGLSGATETWEPVLRPVPPRIANALPVMVRLGLKLEADPLLYWQYLPALERAVELLRPAGGRMVPDPEAGVLPRHDSPVGRYVHLELDGRDHRIYYEETGSGIPLVLQHTAGAHSVQWRHLFEDSRVTDHFRLIAYDLPFHGKSLPPVGPRWWETEYRLTGDFLRQVPVALVRALGLRRPVFMGCSVGGLLALDLALHHPDLFRSVIAVEGSLHIGGDLDELVGLWHPQVSNHSKARMMESLCSPSSPEAYVKEVSQVYSAGWPPAFRGDLNYYMLDFDLRADAHRIDTEQVGVHILNGEYDYSGTTEMGRAASDAIPGSTHKEMGGLGHFPMQENPEEFLGHLLPILDRIRAERP